MKRILVLMAALVLFAQAAAAQVVTTEEPGAQPALQPTVEAPPTQAAISSDVLPILVNARSDLEILANQQLGSERPAGWSGSLDINNPQLPILIRLDLDLLMASLVGLESIPQGWFGAVPSTPYSIARDIRHDLELLSDIVVGPSVRPPGWTGDDPIMRCDRSTQNLVRLLRKNYRYEPSIMPTTADYCFLLAVQVGQFVEANVLEGSAVVANAPAQNTGGPESALADMGLAFLDRDATQRVGTIPTSETFTAVGRSLTQFSRMTLVRGADFEVFVDYSTTTISETEFLSLPDINTLNAQPFCNAAWCN